MARLFRIAPEIPVSDLRQAIQYYEQKLGFKVVAQMPAGDYAVVERDDVAIHLFTDDAGHHSPVGIHVFTHRLDDLHAELLERGAELSQKIMRKPWGSRDFRVKDQSGNELKFTEPVPNGDDT
jgi:uncharacterized glyoxalase superfamily protein PhnB